VSTLRSISSQGSPRLLAGAPKPGDVIDGLYQIQRLHAEGGMGTVYEGVFLNDGRRVAIKVLRAEVAQDETIVRRFEREAQAASRIGSPNIVEVLDLGLLPGGVPFLVMEFLEGESLDDRMRSPIAPEELLPIVIQLLEALAEAHRAGIIHRDLKPANVFLVSQGAGAPPLVKVLDFGVSKIRSGGPDNELTAIGVVVGTPFYMAPEQAIPDKPVDHRADLFSVGVILYRALSGRVPYSAISFADLIIKLMTEQAPPLDVVVPGIDQTLSAIVGKAMAREPEARYGSAAELAEALRRWLSEHRVAASARAPAPLAAAPAPARLAAAATPRAAGQAPIGPGHIAAAGSGSPGTLITAEPTSPTKDTGASSGLQRANRFRWALGIVALLTLLFEIAVLLHRRGMLPWLPWPR
jgi:eukaryotic-like serine/threonine-protein kinase